MPNIMDNLDTFLTAKARFSEWQKEFEEKYYGPVGEVLFGLMKDRVKQPDNTKEVNDAKFNRRRTRS